MEKYSIHISDSITVEQAYNEIVNGGLKVFNTRLNAQFAWMPNNQMEIIEFYSAHDVLPTIDIIPSYDDFVTEYGKASWYYGYICD